MWNFDLAVKMKIYFLVSTSQKLVKTAEKESWLINELVFDSLMCLMQESVGRTCTACGNRATRATA